MRSRGRCRARALLLIGVSTALAGATGAGAAGVEADPSGDEAWLIDTTSQSGLDFGHVRTGTVRYWLPEIMSGGVCWLDFDRDGDLDLYLVQGGEPVAPAANDSPAAWRNALYRNDGPGGFVETAAAAGVDDAGYGMGCTVGDIDADGWVDLYVTNLGPNALYRNRGDGGFDRRGSESGAGDDGWGASSAFFDYDLDGDLDLFVVNYIDWSPDGEVECFSGGLRDYCHPDRYAAPAPDRLLRNRGDGSFEDVTQSAGIGATYGNGLGVTVADFDGDTWPDVYVANDGMANQLWSNQGDGTFRDVALLGGVAVNRVGSPEAGMGVQAFDVDDDLDLDLMVTHLRAETNTLYIRQGEAQFADRTAASGLGAASLGFTGFGLGFADFDSDGRVDLFVANGRVGRGLAESARQPFTEPDHLYRGLGEGRFELLSAAALGTAGPETASRGAALGDADSDGDVDLVVIGSGAAARLLTNRLGTESSWSAVRVLTEQGSPEVGARVILRYSEGERLRVVQPAYGYCTANESRVHFGLGKADRIESIAVDSPRGRRRRYIAPPVSSILVLPALRLR